MAPICVHWLEVEALHEPPGTSKEHPNFRALRHSMLDIGCFPLVQGFNGRKVSENSLPGERGKRAAAMTAVTNFKFDWLRPASRIFSAPHHDQGRKAEH